LQQQQQQQQQQQLQLQMQATAMQSSSGTSLKQPPTPGHGQHGSRQQPLQQQQRAVLTPAYKMDDLIRHLKAKGVTTVVRLNNKTYDRARFVAAGFEHVDL
jgi:hypothetical protein